MLLNLCYIFFVLLLALFFITYICFFLLFIYFLFLYFCLLCCFSLCPHIGGSLLVFFFFVSLICIPIYCSTFTLLFLNFIFSLLFLLPPSWYYFQKRLSMLVFLIFLFWITFFCVFPLWLLSCWSSDFSSYFSMAHSWLFHFLSLIIWHRSFLILCGSFQPIFLVNYFFFFFLHLLSVWCSSFFFLF